MHIALDIITDSNAEISEHLQSAEDMWKLTSQFTWNAHLCQPKLLFSTQRYTQRHVMQITAVKQHKPKVPVCPWNKFCSLQSSRKGPTPVCSCSSWHDHTRSKLQSWLRQKSSDHKLKHACHCGTREWFLVLVPGHNFHFSFFYTCVHWHSWLLFILQVNGVCNTWGVSASFTFKAFTGRNM